MPPPTRRRTSPRENTSNNSKMGLILGSVILVVAVISYFVYSSWEKNKYINETLALQATFSKQMDEGKFQVCLNSANAIQNRFDVRAKIFSEEQKKSFATAVKNLKRQIELQEILEKIRIDSEGENKKSLTKISALKKELIGKVNLLKPEMNAFILNNANELQTKLVELQKNLFREEFRKTEKEWDNLVTSGKFVEAATQFKEYLTAAKDPADPVYNAFIDKAFPIETNKFEIQRKLYEEALAVYNKGVTGSDSDYSDSLVNFDKLVQKIPLEYPALKTELKAKYVQLKGAQRSRYRLRMNTLPLEKAVEKDQLETKAFSLEMPNVAKVVYSKATKPELERLSSILKTELPFFKMEKETIDEVENNVSLIGAEYAVQSGFIDISNNKYVLLIINGVRLAYGANLISDSNLRQSPDFAKYIFNHAYEVARKLKLIDEACEMADQNWNMSMLSNFGLGLVAETTRNGTTYVMVEDKLFKVEKQNFDRKDSVGPWEKFRSMVKDLGTAISQSPTIEKEIAKPMVLLTTAISERIDYNHQISTQFAQLALVNDYFEKTIPNCPSDVLEKAKNVKTFFIENIIKPISVIEGKTVDGSETKIFTSISGFNSRWTYDKERDETSFVRSPSVIELDDPRLFASRASFAIVYKGKHEKDPKVDPIRIEAQHITGGVIATYDYSNKKFYVDINKWNRHVLTVFKMPELYGIANWSYPPHVLNIDIEGNIKEMFVPNGRFALMDFTQYKSEEEKLKAKNEWLDQAAAVLKSNGELHLLYKYFTKYTFDSPVPNMNNLIGNNSERGEFHQTIYQTMDRNLGNKMLCDCDDLAEVYADITKRQGKISYVMGVPGHATCGWIDKLPDGYAMNFLDTGPPRRIVDKSLDVAIEKGVKSYDQRNLLSFNARSISFLFRFAGEQVRQGYQLDSKIFVDNAYGCSMVDVQEAWHFHYYLQGVETMEGILKTDKAAANYFEISGLYRQMGVYDQAVKYYKLGLDQLDKKDEFGLIQSNMMYINYNQRLNPAVALELLKENQEKLKKVNVPVNRKELVEFEMANIYLVNKKPVEAYKIIQSYLSDNPNALNERLVVTLNSIYALLNNKVREGQPATEEEKPIIARLELLVKRYYDHNHFKAQDDIYGSIYKYNGLYSFYIAKYGQEACLKKLKEARYPKSVEKNHVNRAKTTEEEDWDWIRLNIYNYYSAIFQALGDKKTGDDENDADSEKPIKALPTPEKWKEAMQYQDIMEQVYLIHKEKGLGKQSEYMMLLARMLRGVVEKNEKLVDATLDKMQKDDWTTFYRMVGDSIGGMCDLVPKEDFLKLFNKFSAKNPPKQHFLGIAYRAFLLKKYDIAVAVAEVSAKKFKDDPKMEKEFNLLKAFVLKQKPQN